MTKLINGAIVAFSLTSIVLGALAYFAPREGHDASIVSLIAGGAIGLLMLTSLWLWASGRQRFGRIMSAVLCVLCLGNFVPKMSKGFYPNGLMAVFTLVLFVLLAVGHMTAKSSSTETSG